MDTNVISAAVGAGGSNKPADVKTVQMLLNNWLRRTKQSPLKVDGIAGPKTSKALTTYQRSIRGEVDGLVKRDGPTIKALFVYQLDLLQQGGSIFRMDAAKRTLASHREFRSLAQHVDVGKAMAEFLRTISRDG